MRAILVRETGGPDVLKIEQVPEPAPTPGEVLVRVKVAGVNHFDLSQRADLGGATPFIPGVDAAGVRLDTGQRVLVSGASGCYAEYVAASENDVWPLPESVDDVTAVALAVPYRTAWAGIVDVGNLRPGDILLVQAGSSATGQASIDIGRAAGAKVFATASASKFERLRAMGAEVLAYDDERLSGLGANVIYDPVGAESIGRSVEALAHNGIVVIPGALGNPIASFDVWSLVAKHGRLAGIGATTDREIMSRILELASEGNLHPVVDGEMPLENAADAHRALESRETFGKVVLRV